MRPPYQFSIRTMLRVTAMTAAALGMIMWLGTNTAPIVLAGCGGLIGYSTRNAAPVEGAYQRRGGWGILWMLLGVHVGLLIQLAGRVPIQDTLFCGGIALVLLVALVVSSGKRIAPPAPTKGFLSALRTSPYQQTAGAIACVLASVAIAGAIVSMEWGDVRSAIICWVVALLLIVGFALLIIRLDKRRRSE